MVKKGKVNRKFLLMKAVVNGVPEKGTNSDFMR